MGIRGVNGERRPGPEERPDERQPAAVLLPLPIRHAAQAGQVQADAGRAAPADLDAIEALARAVASSPVLRRWERTVLVLRRGPQPALGLLGYLSPSEVRLASALGEHLSGTVRRYRPVTYDEVEAACHVLAERLRRRLGPDLEEAGFVAIPRGGLVVLGLLSYALRLRQRQLERPERANGPLIVVDDCALSGARFRAFGRRFEERTLVFAPLYSHPTLRRTIARDERNVQLCVSGADLRDYAPELLGDEYPAWCERWRARGGDGYWAGILDHLAFPWGEPDVSIWSPTGEGEVSGFRVAPPEACMKNRYSDPESEGRLQIQVEGAGPLRPAPSVLHARVGTETLVANLEDGSCFSLADTAADLWRAVVELGDPGHVERALAQRYSGRDGQVRKDAREFIERLLRLGVLVEEAEAGERSEAAARAGEG